jgi:alkylresorcinol/alkylpyrone synthase
LGLSEDALVWSRRSLAEVGNLSSAAVLFVLADVLEKGRPRTGDRALVAALGPGFGAELLVLEWET